MPELAAPLGVFGGTFDPVHLGHLRLAEEAAEAGALGEVLWLPAGQPPHREAPQVRAQDRLRMVELATADNPRFGVDASEVLAAEPSYTVTTLERLRREHGGERPLALIVGADAFAGLTSWHRWRELFELAHFVVAHRPGYALAAEQLPGALGDALRARGTSAAADLAAAPAGRILSFAMTALDVSATRIRTLLAEGRSGRYLVPPAVLDYIQLHRLYRPLRHFSP